MLNNNSKMKLLLMLQLFGVFSAFALDEGYNNKLAPSIVKQDELLEDHSDIERNQAHSMLQANLQEERKSSSNISLEIINGYNAKLGEFPFFVSVRYIDKANKRVHSCGGTILSPSIILTAAHCLRNVSLDALAVQPTLKFPGPREEANWIPVTKACAHKRFNFTISESNDTLNSTFDVAILKLERSIKFSKHVHSARRPTAELPYDTQAYTVGLGLNNSYLGTHPNTLQVLPVERVACHASNSGLQHFPRLCVKQNQQRYVGTSCYGDSGSPLVWKQNGKQTVFGVTSLVQRFCSIGWPFVTADVYNLRSDIDELIRDCSQ